MEKGCKEIYSMDGGMLAWNGLIATGQYDAGMDLLKERKTTEEMVSLAWALEQGTGFFYRQIEKSIHDEEAKNIFKSLMDAEERHKKRLLDSYSDIKGVTAVDEVFIKESLKGIMEGGFSIDRTLDYLKSRDMALQDTLEVSMQAETNSLDLYTKIIRRIEDESAKKIFAALLEEEKVHLERLGKLLDSRLRNAGA